MSESSEASRRRFGVGDAMILVAATAVALGWIRKPLEYRVTFYRDGRVIDNIRPATIVGAGMVATWTLASLSMRLRSPRPDREALRRQPGFLACLAATVASVVKLVGLFAWGAAARFRFEIWYVPSVLGQLVEPAAMAVVGAWLALALAGAWRRERTWVDDLGIGVGVWWIGLEVAGWVALCLD